MHIYQTSSAEIFSLSREADKMSRTELTVSLLFYDSISPSQINYGFVVVSRTGFCKAVIKERKWTQSSSAVVSIDQHTKGQRNPTFIRHVSKIKVKASRTINQVSKADGLCIQGMPIFLPGMGFNVHRVGSFTRR